MTRTTTFRFALFWLCFVTALGSAQTLYSSYEPLGGEAVLEASLLQKTNAERRTAGVPELAPDERLALAARQHAAEMARLNYFSHTSPSEGRRTPPERAAQAAFPFLIVGENIARMSSVDVATDVTRGWMDSPGHRENLLLPDFTHVGFGTAKDARGQTVVVQVFGRRPYRLLSANLVLKRENQYRVDVDIDTPQGGNFVINYGDQMTEVLTLAAGRHRVPITTAEVSQLHLQLGVMSPNGEGFIFQDAGWLTLASSNYVPDGMTPQTYGQIAGAFVSPVTSNVHEVTLNFDGAADRDLAVFLDDAYLPNAVVSPGVVRLSVPASSVRPAIVIGERSGSSVSVNMMLTVSHVGGRPVLSVLPAD